MKLDFENQADDVRIELIPLIDVVFCILIFFILASLQLTRQQAISIDLPQASTSALQTQKSLIVSIDGGGQYYVDQQPVTADNLFYTMQGFEAENPTGLMILYADRSATYDNVVQLLDLMRSVGGDRVALATQPPQPSSSGQPTIPGLPADSPGGLPANVPDNGLGLPPLPGVSGDLGLPAAPADPFGQGTPLTPNLEEPGGLLSPPDPFGANEDGTLPETN